MLYYDFQNYEGFKERFGVAVHGNGSKSRKNKILLSYVKQPSLLRDARMTGDYSELNLSSMTALWRAVWRHFYYKSQKFGGEYGTNYLELLGVGFYSKKYKLDALNGICEDRDMHAIRYVNVERGKVFKMKPGKFLSALLDECGYTLPDPVRLWMCEEFTRKWETKVASIYSTDLVEPYHLVIDDDFESIYDQHKCDGYFGSCMSNRNNWTFYRDAVSAKAASLRSDQGGVILARCVIFTKVYDEDGKVYRLAERQYAPVGKFNDSSKDNFYNNLLKRLLVDELIKSGEIDGYKQVGAGCGDDRGFVSCNGDSLSDKEFRIDCELEDGDRLSYQDSFGYFCEDRQTAYNFEPDEYDEGPDDERECLKTTRGYYTRKDEDECENYDEYREEYVDGDLIEVNYHGRHIMVEDSGEGLYDFVWVESEEEYYHEDDVSTCERCGEYYVSDEGYYSKLTDEYYCCEECMEEAENEWREDNMYFSEYDSKWFENEDDVTELGVWNAYTMRYELVTISFDSLQKLIEKEEVVLCNGTWYELPYTYESRWEPYAAEDFRWAPETGRYEKIISRRLINIEVRVY